jgi:hypothetical protein
MHIKIHGGNKAELKNENEKYPSKYYKSLIIIFQLFGICF